MGVLVTLTGQVVDLLCYDVQTKTNTGVNHPMGKECAWACRPQREDCSAHHAPVTIRGEVIEKDGMLMLTASDVTMVKARAK